MASHVAMFVRGTTAVVASLAAATAFASVSPEQALAKRLHAALERADARVVVERIEAPAAGCRPDWSRLEVEGRQREGEKGGAAPLGLRQPLTGSGRLALQVPGSSNGHACEAWIWARVHVFAPVPVALKAVHAGGALEGAWALQEREIRPGFSAWAGGESADAQADRSLAAGQIIGEDMVRRAGLAPGQPVKVLLLAGAVAVEESGTVVPCGRTKACAVLPSGRHLEGTWEDGRLVVRAP